MKNNKCPHCGGTGTLIPHYNDSDEAFELREWCSELRIEVAPDGTLSRRDAARLLRRSPFTLRNWALTGKGPGYVSYAGRYRYSLEALGFGKIGTCGWISKILVSMYRDVPDQGLRCDTLKGMG
jgi:hypothetical protein